MAIPAIAIHGGAGPVGKGDTSRHEAHLAEMITDAKSRLEAGVSSVDVVVEVVRAMEASGLYVAGRGASPNNRGGFELDACIMDGWSRRAGAVSALEGFVSPIDAARLVMDKTPHVMMAGEGAAELCAEHGLQQVTDPANYYLKVASDLPRLDNTMQIGTVGAVALDKDGKLAAATSTAGVLGKLHGRVGDTPIVGAGTWADRIAAVSCTGFGEYFILANAAATVTALMRYGGAPLEEATDIALGDVARLGGVGGLIAIDKDGDIRMPFNTEGMRRAAAYPDGRVEVAIA